MPYGLSLVTPPAVEPVTLRAAKDWLRIDPDDTTQDEVIRGDLAAAREFVESVTGRALITQTWRMTIDRFPTLFWVGSWGNSYQDYQGYQGPSQGAGQGNWQWTLDGKTIRLPKPPLQSVTSITYTATDGTPASMANTTVAASVGPGGQVVTPASMAGISEGTLLLADAGTSQEAIVASNVTATTFQTTFALSHAGPFALAGFQAATTKTPALLSPVYGASWPIARPQYESVQITFVCGYGADTSFVPEVLKRAIKMLAAHWYEHREAVAAGTMGEVPLGVQSLLAAGWTGEYP